MGQFSESFENNTSWTVPAGRIVFSFMRRWRKLTKQLRWSFLRRLEKIRSPNQRQLKRNNSKKKKVLIFHSAITDGQAPHLGQSMFPAKSFSKNCSNLMRMERRKCGEQQCTRCSHNVFIKTCNNFCNFVYLSRDIMNHGCSRIAVENSELFCVF